MGALEQGASFLRAGRFHEALAQFVQALREQPASPEPRIGMAQALQGSNDLLAATAWLTDACRVAPQRIELWSALGAMLASAGRYAEVDAMLPLAFAMHPHDRGLRVLQAESHVHQRRMDSAVACYEALAADDPDDVLTQLHLGYCLDELYRFADAIAHYRRAIALQPDFMEAHVNLAGALWRVGDFEGTLAHAQRAVQLAPDNPFAVRILGTALLNLNRLEEAEVPLRRALALKPGFDLARVDLAFLLLLQARYEEGWAMYGARWHDTARLKRPPFSTPQLEWRGPKAQPLAGKRITVYAEQGLGDTIQFCRYLPLLRAQGADVSFIVAPQLAPLLANSLAGIDVLPATGTVQTTYVAALLDLPLLLGGTVEATPAAIPYLRAPPPAVGAWRERLSQWNSKRRIGIAWAGSPTQANNINRSLHLSACLPLLQVPGVQWFNLQKMDAGAFTDVDPASTPMIDLAPQWSDFADSAAMVTQLDLVITVDTAVAHLAGALGVPVWVLLGPNADWRWLVRRDDSPWYPGVMRLFRRAHGEAPAVQVQRVVEALRMHGAPPAA